MGIVGAVLAIVIWAVLRGKNSTVKLNLPPKIARWESEIETAAQEFGISKAMLAAIIRQESNGDSGAIGSAGEIGLGQLKQIAVNDLIAMGYDVQGTPAFDPLENARQTAAYFDLQKKRMGSDYRALVAYNRGQQGANKQLEQEGTQSGERYAENVLQFKKNFEDG